MARAAPFLFESALGLVEQATEALCEVWELYRNKLPLEVLKKDVRDFLFGLRQLVHELDALLHRADLAVESLRPLSRGTPGACLDGQALHTCQLYGALKGIAAFSLSARQSSLANLEARQRLYSGELAMRAELAASQCGGESQAIREAAQKLNVSPDAPLEALLELPPKLAEFYNTIVLCSLELSTLCEALEPASRFLRILGAIWTKVMPARRSKILAPQFEAVGPLQPLLMLQRRKKEWQQRLKKLSLRIPADVDTRSDTELRKERLTPTPLPLNQGLPARELLHPAKPRAERAPPVVTKREASEGQRSSANRKQSLPQRSSQPNAKAAPTRPHASSATKASTRTTASSHAATAKRMAFAMASAIVIGACAYRTVRGYL